MFSQLTTKLSDVFNRLRGRGALSEADVDAALRDIRIALLEGDVALKVVKTLLDEIKAEAVGQKVAASINPAQLVIKIVHDAIKRLLGDVMVPLQLAAPPSVILVAGLQGTGKTTSCGKLAYYLKKTGKAKNIALCSLDVYRPAARQQLATLAAQVGATLIAPASDSPLEIAQQALAQARQLGVDVLILDSAGRLHLDAPLMDEIRAVHAVAQPTETLLVADAMLGQDAVRMAESFAAALPLTGIILTRVDGDARGGAALSLRAATAQPIKFFGVGEKPEALEEFHPDRLASRILGMGDVVSLVEKALAETDKVESEKLAARAMQGQFDLTDLASQLKQIRRLGGVTSLLGMLPGLGKAMGGVNSAQVDDSVVEKQLAIINSMTPLERQRPDILQASRKRRVAAGAGVDVAAVNRLLKQHQEMAKMMKKMRGMMQGGKPKMSLPPFSGLR